ncbi:alpha-1,2-mannosidase, putative [Curtobacterium sp. UNCCL20]|uniref:GH92 family glycosyl hydrolase n=1 Tax=Curtobacterium sp. UNCCL20 TaxID=1502773 RepID=UPI00088F8ED9|nr:GH92 family glycosyl hydrolase [Curtobacterium sp. UNCCL20]SDQ11195.1 alpha-1,2-mannosidase, putative [Curtobacterium sp. UNCCL20]
MRELQRSGGPTTAVAARNGAGFGSAEAFLVERPAGAGMETAIVPGWSGRTVEPGQLLSWVWFPERTLPEGATEPSEADLPHFWDATAFALDVVFSDGSRLSDRDGVGDARDQYGDLLTPAAQDAARKQWVDQWNRRAVDLTPFAGRVVDRLEARLGSTPPVPAADGARPTTDGERDDGERPALRGWLDDVRIEAAPPTPATPLGHVRTTRGTQASSRFSRGNNAPLVGLPHGGVFGLPMTDASSNRWPYAYQEHHRATDHRPAIQAFATSHIPSPWMGDRGVFQVMPSPIAEPDVDRQARALGFDHDHELDGPHRYRVDLDQGVTAEMTAGEFALGFRFTGARSIVLDHHGRVLDASVSIVDGTALVDVELDDRPGTPPHFVHVRIPGATEDHTTFDDGLLRGWVTVEAGADADADAGTAATDVLLGISTVSPADARANLDAAGTFDTMRARAEEQWTAKLATLSFEGATPDQLTSLYSGLYRLFLYPNRAGETARTGVPRHRSPYGSVQAEPIRDEPGPEIVEGPFTTTNGFWDTYRTAWPLLALLTPETAGELAQGFVEHHHDGGWTPRWSAPGAEDCMTGTTSDTVFADLAAKGVTGFDLPEAYRSALRNATVPPRDERVGRKGSLPGAFRGHVDTATHEGMSWTLDAAINDWGLAVMASLLASRARTPADLARYEAEAEWFSRRSLQYRNVFDPERGFFIGRDPDGSWRIGTEFDPRDWGDDYTETNAWGTAFTAPHDGAGVVDLHGGPDRFDAALDAFFATPETGATTRSGSYGFPIHEMTEARDVRMGMLGLSNQPAHHIPFFPMFTGRHDDAHRIVRECLERLFVGSDLGQGYPGDEDNGEMSAWYVFATIGLYPLAPSTGTYVLVPPSVRRTVLQQPGGAATVIEVADGSAGAYVASVTVDGEPWESVTIPHAVVVAASRIEFTLSPTPLGWASETRPVSASEVHGYRDTPVDVLPPTTSLTDDDGRTVTTLGAGTSVSFDVPTVESSLYTVTAASPGVLSWEVSLGGTRVAVQDAVFDWAGQTRVFRLQATGTTFTLTAVSDLALTQLELIAADGQR